MSSQHAESRNSERPNNDERPHSRGVFPTTHVSLIENLKADDDRSWKLFFEVYGPIVHRFARYARLDANGADEVLANVMRGFLQAIRSGFTVNYSLGRFRDYFRTVTNREIHAYRRNAAKLSGRQDILDAIEPEDQSAAIDSHWVELERQERFRVCIKRLRATPAVRPRDFQAFERYALRNEPAKTVATDFGISTSRLYAIKHEMIRHLRQIGGELDEQLGEV